jgi:hypothetical protein
VTAAALVMNGKCIIMGSDSAVWHSSRKVSRTSYDGVKIVSLASVGPFGAMLYGRTQIGGYSWSTLLDRFQLVNGVDSSSASAVALTLITFKID